MRAGAAHNSRGIVSALVAAAGLIAPALALGDGPPRGEVNARRALVYLIQPGGSRRHVYSGQEWLGAVDADGYAFAHLEPGEHFVWSEGGRAFGAVYLTPGSVSYLEVGARSITLLDGQTGETLLEQATRYSAAADTDAGDAYGKLDQYRAARARASRAGLFRPCRFAAEKRADHERRARAGDAGSSHILGNLYWYGECEDADPARAIAWYRDAAQRGHVGAMVTLGNIYYRGNNVAEDPAEAAAWYRLAAERGDLFSQRRLADMYREGRGVAQSTGQAITWYRRAAEENNDRWSLVQLQAIDPEILERKRAEAEAEARAAEEEERRLEARRQRAWARRVGRIRGKYGELGLYARPFGRAARLDPPTRKKPPDEGSRWDSGVAYALPPEIALGVVALGMVFNAVERSLDSRLSAEERSEIEATALTLQGVLSEASVTDGLTRHVVAAGTRSGDDPLFELVGGPDAGNGSASATDRPDAVVELETTGIGLMPAAGRYRPTRFVMSTRVRLLRRSDGVVLKDRALCYASEDAPMFSAWAAGGGDRLRREMDAAYARTAQTILLILADEAYGTDTRSTELCEALEDTVNARRASLAETDR